MDLFTILGIDSGVDKRQIREAYRKLAKKFHPDLNPDNPRASDRFKEVAHAYWVLSDPQRRKAYLELHPYLRSKKRTQRDFKSDTGKPTPEARPAKPQEGRDILVRLYLTLEELAEGAMKRVKIRRRQLCTDCEGTGIFGGAIEGVCSVCKGTGTVPDFINRGKSKGDGNISCRKCGGSGLKPMTACHICEGRGHGLKDVTITVGIPPGAGDQEKIVVKGQGHEGFLGGKSGDLRVIVIQKEHAYLIRMKNDLDYHCFISLTQWLEGCVLKVPSLNGAISLTLKPGCTPEGVLKVRGRGMPVKGGGRGDMIVKYSLATPDKLSRKHLSILKRLEATDGFSPQLDSKGWCRRKDQKAADIPLESGNI